MTDVPDFFAKPNGSKIQQKTKNQRLLINQTIYILQTLGIPVTDKTQRALEKMAMAFLAVADVKKANHWSEIKDANDGNALKTREIIEWINGCFSENISPGSYDDIRRKDLKHLIMAEIVIRSKPNSDRNDPTRAYSLNPEYSGLIRKFGIRNWEKTVERFFADKIKLTDELAGKRILQQVPISIAPGKTLSFSPGAHNLLQKSIIEEFLPRYGFGAEILYVGDAADKFKYLAKDRLKELDFFELSHGELPDVIAYSAKKNWLYLIEAVKSSGPISPERHFHLKKLTSKCKADIVFVTSFPDRPTFRKFAADISWETEVWIADSPDHLIHFNGDKFLGPYKPGA